MEAIVQYRRGAVVPRVAPYVDRPVRHRQVERQTSSPRARLNCRGSRGSFPLPNADGSASEASASPPHGRGLQRRGSRSELRAPLYHRAMSRSSSTIALPCHWKTCVKSSVVHAIGLALFGITAVRGWCANSPIARVQLASENERLNAELGLLREELRIKDARLARIPARNRPHYPPTERMAILALKAARGWNNEQIATRFLVTAATIAGWMLRLDEQGPTALVQVPEPINRFPDLVVQLVQRLRVLCPAMGKVRIAQTLARAGLHLGVTTVHRLLQRPPAAAPPVAPHCDSAADARTVKADCPHHVWNVDLTVAPTLGGFWVPWFPLSLVQRWPFCWWALIVIDHFSRAAIGFAVFDKQPTAQQVCAALDRAVHNVGRSPTYTVTDHGSQFQQHFRQWCARRGVKPRYGAVGRRGSISVVERFIRSMKDEALRAALVPLRLNDMRAELVRYFQWYNLERPHTHLSGATPAEVLRRTRPANRRPRLEPRARYPANGRCAAPHVGAREPVGCGLRLTVSDFHGARHLPVVRIRKAA
jgi:putative transposase